MKNSAEKLLLDSLKTKKPILCVGAGFSCDAYSNNRTLPLSSELKDILFNEFYVKNCPDSVSDEEISQLKSMPLSELCKAIENDGRKNQLDDFLVSLFKNASPNENDPYHNLIAEYYWDKIYTFNIDDLIENIYQSHGISYVVQNELALKPTNQNRQIIKLHGCVNKPDLGFIFSSNDYYKNAAIEDFKLKEFGHDYYSNDIIFLGTQFNEPDIHTLLEKNKLSGYNNSGRNYFFVSPKISYSLKSLIARTDNYHYIQWDTKTFLLQCASIKKQSKDLKTQELLLEQIGFLKVQDYINVPQPYESKLYYGNKITFYDIFADWDFIRVKTKKIIDKINHNNSNSVIVTLYGKAFTGKSVVAYRILAELYKSGYKSYVYNCAGEDELAAFKTYLLFDDCKHDIAILIDDAAYLYDSVAKFVNDTTVNVNKIVFILVSNSDVHKSKEYELIGTNTIEWEITDVFNDRSALVIYSKLKEKSRLGKYRKMSERRAIQEIHNFHHLIDFLFNLTYGEGFKAYFRKQLIKLNEVASNNEIQLIEFLYVLSKLEITNIHECLIRNLFSNINCNKFDNLVVGFGESSGIYLRCSDAYDSSFNISDNDKTAIIYKTALYVANMFSEKDNNRWKIMFEKLLKVQSLKYKLHLSNSSIIDLFVKLEKYYNNVSYYWLQRGIAKQINAEYDDAENFLQQALSIRPNSYQIRHAIAKNKLEKASNILDDRCRQEEAYDLFTIGLNELMELIESPQYSKSLNYSVHAYIDTTIKFYKKMNEIIPLDLIEQMHEVLTYASRINYDDWMNNCRKNLFAYCNEYYSSEAALFDISNFKQYKDRRSTYRV